MTDRIARLSSDAVSAAGGPVTSFRLSIYLHFAILCSEGLYRLYINPSLLSYRNQVVLIYFLILSEHISNINIIIVIPIRSNSYPVVVSLCSVGGLFATWDIMN